MPEETVKSWPLRGYWEATQIAVRSLKETYTKLGVLPPYAVGESIDRVLSTSLDDISVPGFKAMTDQIKDLEESLGAELFERSSRQVRLTPFGESFAPRVRDILRAVDHLNLTTQWAQSKASDDALEQVTDSLLMAMHDLRTVLVRKKSERLLKAEAADE